LTSTGQEFIAIAERWMALSEDTNNIRYTNKPLLLTIGSLESLHSYIFSDFYRKVCTELPQICLNIQTAHSLEIYELVEKRDVDIGFVLREARYTNVIVEPFFCEDLVVIRQASEKVINKTLHSCELDSRNEIAINWGPNFQVWHEKWWDRNIHPSAKIDTISLLLPLLFDPKHWAIVPISIAKSLCAVRPYEILNISDPPPKRECYILTHRNPKPSTSQALQSISTYLNEIRSIFQFPELY